MRCHHTGTRLIVICGCFLAISFVGSYYMIRRHVLGCASTTIQQAERALRRRDNAQVRETLKWLLWFDPRENKALLLTGISLNADRRFTEAIEVLDRIPESSESFEQGGIALAASLILDGQLERAESILKRQLARFPQSQDAHERLVRLYLKELRKRDANALLVDRWHRCPDDLSVLPDLLELEVKPVTPHERAAFLEAADRKHPNQAPVVLGMARAYSLMGMPQQARDQFQTALELSPNDPVTRILAAEFYLDSGDLDTAESMAGMDSTAMTDVFVELHDDRYWFVRCRIADQSGDAGIAYAHLQKALALRPHDETYVLMQAALLRQLGRLDEAAKAASEATRLAEARKHLMLLSDKLDRSRPNPAHCLAIAELLESIGYPELSADWRHISRAIAQLEPADALPPPAQGRLDTIETNSP